MRKNAPPSAASRANPKRDPIPENFRTIEELWEFWDTHSTADYPEFLEPVRASIRLNKIGRGAWGQTFVICFRTI